MARKSTKQPTPESEDSSSSRSTSPEPMEGVEETKREAEESSSSGSEEEGSGSSGSSESESESSEEDNGKKDSKPAKKSSVAFPAPAFKPPTGFKSVKKQSAPSSNTSSILSNLRGKQVLHITAPAFLPLSKVKEVSLAKVMQGEPVLKHNGVNYGIPAENLGQADGGKKLLLYDSKTQTYYNAPAGDVQSYHVQELISLPETLRNEDKPLSAEDYAKPPRKQPKHLKMRFRPVGSGQGPVETLGSSSEESEAEEPTFKVPKGSSKEKDERKRKHQEGDGNQPAALPRKKSKKQTSSQEEVDEKKSKKSSKSRDEKKRKKAEKA